MKKIVLLIIALAICASLCGCVYIRVYEKNEYATFEISDDGCGIDEERIDKIFSGNYAAQRESVDSEKRNAGIGLSVCASIIKAHGGKIYAENLKDGGALFGFILKTDSLAGDENGAE